MTLVKQTNSGVKKKHLPVYQRYIDHASLLLIYFSIQKLCMCVCVRMCLCAFDMWWVFMSWCVFLTVFGRYPNFHRTCLVTHAFKM